MEKKHIAYVPIPLALQRAPQTIRYFYEKGLYQKQKLVKLYSLHNDNHYYHQLYSATVDESVITEALSFPCSGLSIDNIVQSDWMSTSRKEDLVFGCIYLVHGGIYTKVRLLHPNKLMWDNALMGGAAGVIISGIRDHTRAGWKVHNTAGAKRDHPEYSIALPS